MGCILVICQQNQNIKKVVKNKDFDKSTLCRQYNLPYKEPPPEFSKGVGSINLQNRMENSLTEGINIPPNIIKCPEKNTKNIRREKIKEKVQR
jgi:hypothetical protein